MILSAVVHGQYRQCETSEQLDALIIEIMTTLDPGNPWRDLDCGETVALYFADTPLRTATFAEPPFSWTAIHELVVSVNRKTGYAAIRWDTESVSSNATAVRDPAVVGDPHVPYWYHPRYAISLAEAETAIRQFCLGDGARPTAIEWSTDGADQDKLYLSTDQYRSTINLP